VAAAVATNDRRAWYRQVVRLAVSAALIAWVLRSVDWPRVGEVAASASVPLIALAFLSYFVGYIASVTRWRVLLTAQGVRLSFGYLYCSFMIGMFFNQLLPSTIGGDLARYRYTAAGGRSAAFSAVVLDRVFGTVALVIFAAIGLAFADSGTVLPAQVPQAVALLLAIGLAILAAAFVAPRAVLRPLTSWWPAAARARLAPVLEAFEAFGGRHDVLLIALCSSLALQAVVITHYYLVGLALGLDVPLVAFAFIAPVATVVMALPISINGIGVREGVLGYLLGLYGVDVSTSLVFAWVLYALVLGQGLLGGVVFAMLKAERRVEE
jgi:uncharacterized protein (TIRG00374 family)